MNNLLVVALVALAIIFALHLLKQRGRSSETYSSVGSHIDRSFYPGSLQFDSQYRRGYIYPYTDKGTYGYYKPFVPGFFNEKKNYTGNVHYPYYNDYPVKLQCPCSL